MAFYEPAKNNINGKHAFYSREEYKINSVERVRDKKRIIDFWYKKPLYGRVDLLGNPVFVLPRSGLGYFNEGQNMFAVDFVVDAFQDMVRFYNHQAAKERILPITGDVTDLVPKRAWESMFDYYDRHSEQMRDYFINTYLAPNSDAISGLDDILKKFNIFVDNHAGDFPLTLTGFTASPLCPGRVSGLSIELLEADHGDDEIKNTIVESENFNSLVNIANKFGFMINKNAPWTLVANLNSPQLKEYMKLYGLTEPNNYFSDYCYPTYLADREYLRSFIYDIYFTFMTNFPIRQKTKICETIKKKSSIRKVLTKDELNSKISELNLLDIYLQIRLKEIGAKVTKDKIRDLKKKVNLLKNYKTTAYLYFYVNLFVMNYDINLLKKLNFNINFDPEGGSLGTSISEAAADLYGLEAGGPGAGLAMASEILGSTGANLQGSLTTAAPASPSVSSMSYGGGGMSSGGGGSTGGGGGGY
jgi:hypothetical protein